MKLHILSLLIISVSLCSGVRGDETQKLFDIEIHFTRQLMPAGNEGFSVACVKATGDCNWVGIKNDAASSPKKLEAKKALEIIKAFLAKLPAADVKKKKVPMVPIKKDTLLAWFVHSPLGNSSGSISKEGSKDTANDLKRKEALITLENDLK